MPTYLAAFFRSPASDLGCQLERLARSTAPLIAVYLTARAAAHHYGCRLTDRLSDLATRLGY